jgi:hypothetical protein
VTPSNVIAGTDVMVTIDAANTNFIAGKTAVGTGSSDVIVRQIWVVDPRKLLVNLTVKPEARLGEIALTISTGLQLATYGAPLQIRPRAADQNSLQAPVLDSATGLAGAPAGATIVLRTATAPSSGSWGVWIGDFAADVFRGEDGWLRTKVPPMAAGPQKVELLPPSGPPIPPVLMQVNEAAPRIVFVEGPAPAEALAPLLVGDRVMLVLTDLAEGGLVPAAGEVDVRVGGVKQAVDVLEELAVEEGQTRRFKVEFHVSPLTTLANDQAVTLRAGTRLSNAVIVSVVAPPVQTSSVRK